MEKSFNQKVAVKKTEKTWVDITQVLWLELEGL